MEDKNAVNGGVNPAIVAPYTHHDLSVEYILVGWRLQHVAQQCCTSNEEWKHSEVVIITFARTGLTGHFHFLNPSLASGVKEKNYPVATSQLCRTHTSVLLLLGTQKSLDGSVP